MFDEIADLAASKSCAFTLYVDDITISGQFATRAMQQEARKIIGNYRLRAHKSKVFAARQPRIVTGVALTNRGHELPNRRARLIAKSIDELSTTTGPRERLDLMPALVGRVSEAAVVDASWIARKDAVVRLARDARLKATAPFTTDLPG